MKSAGMFDSSWMTTMQRAAMTGVLEYHLNHESVKCVGLSHVYSQVACVASVISPLQEKYLPDFLRGGGGCTQANQGAKM